MSDWYDEPKRKSHRGPSLKDQLRKMANRNPRLRRHIRPIIAKLDQKMSRQSFEDWMREVDKHLVREVSMSSLELPDSPYRMWYDDEMTPKEAADMAIMRAGGGGFGL